MLIYHKLTLLPLICECASCYMPLWYFYIFMILLSTNSKIAGYGCRRLLDTDVDDSTRINRFRCWKINSLTLKNLTFYVI